MITKRPLHVKASSENLLTLPIIRERWNSFGNETSIPPCVLPLHVALISFTELIEFSQVSFKYGPRLGLLWRPRLPGILLLL